MMLTSWVSGTCCPATSSQARGRCSIDRDLSRCCLAEDAEQAGLEVVVLLDVDGKGADEGVALLTGVLAHHVAQFARQGLAVDGEPVEVTRREVDGERVGHDGPVAGDDRCSVVALALQGAGDLDRLNL